LEELERVDDHLKSGGDRLQSAAAAVLAINRFLREDEFVETSGLGKALRMLADQLGDAYAGSKQTIFQKGIPRGARPSLAADRDRGITVFCLDLLIKAKMKNAEAARYLAQLLKDIGFKYGNNDVTSKRLLTWREQIGDTSPAAATDTVRQLSENIPVKLETLEDTKVAVKGLLEVIARRHSN